ncbi:DUF5681 domain-containing protein [Ahrensia marina]|uniref:DUF5681 domain-containing protein n=1 Tax=Ahrensia marina TaxID=1514904 RepID=A0A0N0VKW3_9HYPH|nr:DUF5681 domain-containing protein [Ahrensia marina]KPA99893.1 hypothetical protein SU32_16730 [Ahrensia marina]
MASTKKKTSEESTGKNDIDHQRRARRRPPPAGRTARKVKRRPPPKSTTNLKEVKTVENERSIDRGSASVSRNLKEVGETEYKIGYGKPPTHSQFKKGQSGNPKGRPKGKTLFRTEVQEIGRKMATVRTNGKTSKVPMTRVVLQTVLQRALDGDKTSTKQILELFDKYLDEPGDEKNVAEISPADKALIDEYLAEITSFNDNEEAGSDK